MSILDKVKHQAFESYKAVATNFTKPPTESAFKEKGYLTPDEFIAAGDALVHNCPSWSWEAGDPKLAMPFLPQNKQYLITRRVPCRYRAQNPGITERQLDEDDGEWVATDTAHTAGGLAEAIQDLDIDGTKHQNANDDESDDVLDIEAVSEDGAIEEEDDAAAAGCGIDADIERTRTYDVSITYDGYHWTPRVWLLGYDEAGAPLTAEGMLQDMSQDHAEKTVTVDPHPHSKGVLNISIHPCKHAHVMKNMVARAEEQ